VIAKKHDKYINMKQISRGNQPMTNTFDFSTLTIVHHDMQHNFLRLRQSKERFK
jgi:hypothetical protein